MRESARCVVPAAHGVPFIRCNEFSADVADAGDDLLFETYLISTCRIIIIIFGS